MSALQERYPNITLPPQAGKISLFAEHIVVNTRGLAGVQGMALFKSKGDVSADSAIEQLAPPEYSLHDLELTARQALGVVIAYGDVQLVEIDGQAAWFNRNIPGAPSGGGQNVFNIGTVIAYLDPTNDRLLVRLRKTLRTRRNAFRDILGITFTGV